MTAGWIAFATPESPLGDLLDWLRPLLRRLVGLPEPASDMARRIDDLQFLQLVFFLVLGALVFLATFWFAFHYRRRRVGLHPTPEIVAPLWLEIGYSVGLLAAFVLFWWIGFRQYVVVAEPPPEALEVYVTGKQWVWKFAYPEGAASAGILFVPAGRPVRLLLTSRDVIHSFFVPDLRVKQDAVPGRYTTLWFQADRPGRHRILCAEFCGAGHSRMWGELDVLSEEDFGRWLDHEGAPPSEVPIGEAEVLSPRGDERPEAGETMVERGLRIAAAEGCLRCHTTDGTPHVGPTWRGLWGNTVRLRDGTAVVANGPYLTESMMRPEAKIVAGFQPVMPTYQGRLSPGQVAALLELMRALEDRSIGSYPPPRGEARMPEWDAEAAPRSEGAATAPRIEVSPLPESERPARPEAPGEVEEPPP